MDNSWMLLPRMTVGYQKSLEEFLGLMFSNESSNGNILCPCIKCGNEAWVNLEEARMHLICDGFLKGYSIPPSISQSSRPALETLDDMQGLVHDAYGILDENIYEDQVDIEEEEPDEPNAEAKKFYELLEDAEKELYPGCKKFSVLSFIVRLFHSKCIGKCNDQGFTMMLDTLREAFPNASIPKSLYEMKKIIKDLGLSYERIDACPNDCMLYRNENSNKAECDICHTSRYQQIENELGDKSTTSNNHKKIAAKVLRYFPLKPRLQRLYMSSKTAVSMRWHEEGRTKDGCLRHPADSPAWRTFDFQYPNFAKEPRNVRLGLASDGFNPYRTMSVSHSTWPVVLMPYNLPPWMCMKQPYFMLSLLIPGPSAPGNNIDVYLEPLVEELKELWDVGVETYDASTKTNFQMHASLLWTISDFPAYANLSGWSTKGQLACPCCHKHTKSHRLKHGGKYCFIINGFRFHTKELEQKRKTQNSGVVLDARTNSFSSVRDNNPVVGDVTYYGILRDIIELEYSIDKKVVLFDCDWISNGKRKREDENGFTLLNFKGLKPHNEPFILACQAQQVFYVADSTDKKWQVMIKTTARDFYDMKEQPSLDDVDTYLQSEVFSRPQIDENMDIDLTREGFNGIIVDKDIPILDGDEDQCDALS